jgi:phosphoglycolate phosphatase-like HAD superfamily hydrolase
MKFFMDFDGVLCDSAAECYASSLMALRGDPPPENGAIDPRRYRLFMAMRPFIRNPEDYLLIQEAIDSGKITRSQDEFDALRASRSEETLASLANRFLEARSSFLARKPELWYELNPPFEGISELLRLLSTNESFFILSTKRADFIEALFSRWGVQWPSARVISSRTETKRDLMLMIAKPTELGGLHFIDDQEEHLKACQGSGIALYAAEWGYRVPGSPSIGRLIGLAEFIAIAKKLA